MLAQISAKINIMTVQCDSQQTTPTEENGATQARRKIRAALLSVASNASLTLLKLIVGFWSGSVSVLSEALHSGTDLIASGITLLSVRASDTPPDYEHPYGHGKIESISGLAEAGLIFLAAAYIGYEIVERLRTPAQAHPRALLVGIALMALSTVLNFLISQHLFRVAKATDSQAIHADAAHLRTDVSTSLGVFTGLALVRLTGAAWVDLLVAGIVALLLLRTAYRLTREALSPLLDSRLPAAEETAIRQVLVGDARVLGYHKLRTRKSGSQRHADVHVQIDDDVTLVQAHQIAEELEDAIRAALPAIYINIHIEPYYAEMRHQQEAHGVAPMPAIHAPRSADKMLPTPEASTTAGVEARNSVEMRKSD